MIEFNGQLSEYINLPTVKRKWFMHKLTYSANIETEELESIEMRFKVNHESETGEKLNKLDNNDFELITKRSKVLHLPIAMIDQLLTMIVESDTDLVNHRKTIADHPDILTETTEGSITDINLTKIVLNRKLIDIITLIKIIVIMHDMSGYINDEKLHNYLK